MAVLNGAAAAVKISKPILSTRVAARTNCLGPLVGNQQDFVLCFVVIIARTKPRSRSRQEQYLRKHSSHLPSLPPFGDSCIRNRPYPLIAIIVVLATVSDVLSLHDAANLSFKRWYQAHKILPRARDKPHERE